MTFTKKIPDSVYGTTVQKRPESGKTMSNASARPKLTPSFWTIQDPEGPSRNRINLEARYDFGI